MGASTNKIAQASVIFTPKLRPSTHTTIIGGIMDPSSDGIYSRNWKCQEYIILCTLGKA